MLEIFGTTDFNEFKQNLTAETDDKGNPYLAYKIEGVDKVIPIANIVIRESGSGYNGSFKFDMKLHNDFAKELRKATDKVYGIL
jgi:hypothetical protein